MLPAEPEEPGRWCAGIMRCWDARRKQAMMGAMTEITAAAPGMAPAQHPIPTVCGGALLTLSSFSPSGCIIQAGVTAPSQLPPSPHDAQITFLRDKPQAFGIMALAKPLWKHTKRPRARSSLLWHEYMYLIPFFRSWLWEM